MESLFPRGNTWHRSRLEAGGRADNGKLCLQRGQEWSTVNIDPATSPAPLPRRKRCEESGPLVCRKRVYLLPGVIEFEYAADDFAVWTLVRDGGAGDGGSYGDATIIGGSTYGRNCRCQTHRFAFHVESSGWYMGRTRNKQWR